MKLISGRIIEEGEVQFDADRYRFYYQGEDITRDLYFKDAQRIGGWRFDGNEFLRRESAEKRGGSYEKLNESTALELVNQLATDPLSAPIESLGNKADQVFANSGIRKLMIAAVVIFAAYVFIRGGWFIRR